MHQALLIVNAHIAKEGSKSTLIRFNLKDLRMKLGEMKWTPLRVLKAERGFEKVTIEIDTNYLKCAQVPHMELYASQETDGENGEGEEPGGECGQEEVDAIQNEDDLAAMGFLVPFEDGIDWDETFGAAMGQLPDGIDDDHDKSEGENCEAVLEESTKDLEEQGDHDDDCGLQVHWDDDGNLVCDCSDVEEIPKPDGKPPVEPPCDVPTIDEPTGPSDTSGVKKKFSYLESPAWVCLYAGGLTAIPPIQGCGILYNRPGPV